MRITKKNIAYFFVLTSVVFLLLISIIRRPPTETIIHSRLLMGTVVEITFPNGNHNAEEAAQAAFKEIERLEAIFSSYRSDSEISKITASAGKAQIKVSPEVMEVVKIAIKVASLSKGAFDPTFGPLGTIWRKARKTKTPPDAALLADAARLVDFTSISIDTDSSGAPTIGLDINGMSINLGGVAKGYIVGSAARKLTAFGIKEAIVKAGGDMYIFGDHSGSPVKIGIKDPRKKGALFGTVSVTGGSISTSGDYERYFIKDGIRYHHIIDPGTGYPAKGSASVTIVSTEPTLSDSLSTAVFIMGPRAGMALVESLDGVEAVIIDKELKVGISTGLEGNVEIRQ